MNLNTLTTLAHSSTEYVKNAAVYTHEKATPYIKSALGVENLKEAIKHYKNENYSKMAVSGGKCAAKVGIILLAITVAAISYYKLSQGTENDPTLEDFDRLLSSEHTVEARNIVEKCLSKNSEDCDTIIQKAFESLVNKNEHQALQLTRTCFDNPSKGCELIRTQAKEYYFSTDQIGRLATICLRDSSQYCKEISSSAWTSFIEHFNALKRDDSSICSLFNAGKEYISACLKSSSDECKAAIGDRSVFDHIASSKQIYEEVSLEAQCFHKYRSR